MLIGERRSASGITRRDSSDVNLVDVAGRLDEGFPDDARCPDYTDPHQTAFLCDTWMY